MEPVFVYGTLKLNEPNHYHLNNSKNGCAIFRSVASTIKKYPLVISTKYNIPFLLHKEGIGHEINGEVYDVDANMMKYLDEFENHPNFYVRQQTKIKLQNSDIIDCWVYFLQNYPDSFLELQYFSTYVSNGDHRLPYVTRYHREPNDKLLFSNWNNLNHNTSL